MEWNLSITNKTDTLRPRLQESATDVQVCQSYYNIIKYIINTQSYQRYMKAEHHSSYQTANTV